MVELLIKFVPLAVKVNAPAPAVVLFGDNPDKVGDGLLPVIVNIADALVPPPGKGEKTATVAEPAAAIFTAGTTADNCVALIYVVDKAAPFQLMVDPLIKFVPLAVSANAEPPAVALFGAMVLKTGTGLFTITLLIVKLRAPLKPPPGVAVNTVIVALPAVVIFAAGTAAVSCVAFIYVVTKAVPFHLITDPVIKFEPVTVKVKAVQPANAAFGDMDNNVGDGLLPLLLPVVVDDFWQEKNKKNTAAINNRVTILI